MSGPDDKAPRRTGRGFPPEQYRFKPGQSGNPRGRPRGSGRTPHIAALAGDVTPGDAAALKEAYRPIKTSDGEKLTTMEALYRARNIAGMKGSRLSIKDADHRLAELEDRIQRRKEDTFEKALHLQNLAEGYLEIAAERGIANPGIYPHPDDIHLDYETLEVRFTGPTSATEKREWDFMLIELDRTRRMALKYRLRVQKIPQDEAAQAMLIKYTNTFVSCNSLLSERYKRKALPLWLAGRSIPLPDSWLERAAGEPGRRKLKRFASE